MVPAATTFLYDISELWSSVKESAIARAKSDKTRANFPIRKAKIAIGDLVEVLSIYSLKQSLVNLNLSLLDRLKFLAKDERMHIAYNFQIQCGYTLS